MANDGEGVSASCQLPLGGAEPLSHSRLQVGKPGHQSDDRPSRISARLQTNDIADDYEMIAIAEDAQKRKAEEGIRSGPGGEG